MKSLLEEEPTELLGLEEDNDPTESIGFEDQEEEDDPREMMGFGEGEGEEDDSFELGDSEEEDPIEMLGYKDDDDDEADEEESSGASRQRAPGLRVLAGAKAKRRARVTAIAALRARRRARLFAVAALKETAACQAGRLAGRCVREAQSPACIAALSGSKARAPADHRSRPRQASSLRLLKRAAVGEGLRQSA